MFGKHLQLLLIRSKSVLFNKVRYLQAQNSTLNKYNDTEIERDNSIITLINKQKNSNYLILFIT
jgi:hypothetical protein